MKPFGIAWRADWALRRLLRRARWWRIVEGYTLGDEAGAGPRTARTLALAWLLAPHGRWVADGAMCGADGAQTVSRGDAVRAVWRAERVRWHGWSVGGMLRSVATLHNGYVETGTLFADARTDNGHWPMRRVRRCVLVRS